MQAGIFGSVLVLFMGVFLTSWALSQNVQALAVQAKTSAYNDMMRQKQGEACSVSYSFSWGLFGHSTRADSQYCARLAEQVEAPSSSVHLRQLYCNKCPSTCSGYMERCSKDSKWILCCAGSGHIWYRTVAHASGAGLWIS